MCTVQENCVFAKFIMNFVYKMYTYVLDTKYLILGTVLDHIGVYPAQFLFKIYKIEINRLLYVQMILTYRQNY